jgi:hypothetical protein
MGVRDPVFFSSNLLMLLQKWQEGKLTKSGLLEK